MDMRAGDKLCERIMVSWIGDVAWWKVGVTALSLAGRELGAGIRLSGTYRKPQWVGGYVQCTIAPYSF